MIAMYSEKKLTINGKTGTNALLIKTITLQNLHITGKHCRYRSHKKMLITEFTQFHIQDTAPRRTHAFVFYNNSKYPPYLASVKLFS